MILCYHKIFPIAKSHWWLTVDRFHRQMAALQSYEVVHLDRYQPENPNQVVITFDGVYDNVLTHALPVLRQFSYPFELFVIGDWIGRENIFDQIVEPPCWFASLEQLDALVAGGARVQWHTRSHRQLTMLSREECAAELTVPDTLRSRYGAEHLTWFAFPHGAVGESDRDLVQDRFSGALACDDGDPGDVYNLPRTLVFENHDFFRERVAVTISLGKAPWLVRETLASLRQQIVPPDTIRVIPEAAALRTEIDPVLHALAANEGQGLSVGEDAAAEFETEGYLVHLLAGDRLRSDYILACRVALDSRPEVTLVTTDTFVPQATPSDIPPDVVEQSESGRGAMRRCGVEGTNLHLAVALVEFPLPGYADPARLRVELCHREGELVQRAFIEDLRDQEIVRLNEAYEQARIEIDRLGAAHLRDAEEIIRLNNAYGALLVELQRVSEAYGELSREIVRVNEAYGDQQAIVEALRSHPINDR